MKGQSLSRTNKAIGVMAYNLTIPQSFKAIHIPFKTMVRSQSYQNILVELLRLILRIELLGLQKVHNITFMLTLMIALQVDTN